MYSTPSFYAPAPFEVSREKDVHPNMNMSYTKAQEPHRHTTSPTVTGTTVLGLKCKDGVILACDTLGSYGSMARYRDISRLHRVGDRTLVGGSGDYADFQHIKDTLSGMELDNDTYDDGIDVGPNQVYNYLQRYLYQKRSKMNPLWNHLIIAGMEGDEPILGSIDIYGSHYKDNTLATGYGAYIVRPILRNAYREGLTKEEAKQVIVDCMRVMFYRDGRALNNVEIATVTKESIVVDPAIEIDTYWYQGESALGYPTA